MLVLLASAQADEIGRGPAVPMGDPHALVAETNALFLSGGAPVRSGTQLLNQIKLMRPQLDPLDLQLVGDYLARPTESEVVWTSAHFVFHHAAEEAAAPAPESGVLFAAAGTCEHAWEIYHTQQEWPAPPPDEGRGGDARIDIYIRDLGEGVYGYALYEERDKSDDLTGFIAINARLFQEPTHTDLELLQATLAHEYHHLVQFQYGYDPEASWFMEQLATLEEAIVVDKYNGLQEVLVAYATHPYRCLTLSNGAYEYGTWLWAKFLIDHEGFGWPLVRRAWDLWRGEQVTMLTALDLALEEAKSSIDAAYHEWCLWNVQLSVGGAHPYSGPWQPNLTLASERLIQRYPMLGLHPEPLRQPEPLGANYYEMRPQGGSADNVMEVSLQAGAGLSGATLVVWETPSRAPRILTLTPAGDLYTTKVVHWADVQRAILIITNGAQATHASDYALDVRTRYSASVDEREEFLESLMLRNRPNPFEPFTVVSFNLPEEMQVSLRIHDAEGRVIRTLLDGPSSAGQHGLYWNGTMDNGDRSPAGIYYARLATEVGSRQIRIICVR